MGTAVSVPVEEKVWYYWAAPASTLAANALTAATGNIWRNNIGLGACSYRLPYSPYGAAFGIWGIIYLWTDIASALQLLPAPLVTVSPAANLYATLAWALCALWIWLFDATRVSFPLSGLAIAAAAASATAAAILEGGAWRTLAWEPLLLSVVPNSLLGGWLIAASSLGLGSALQALYKPPKCVYLPRDERRELNVPGNPAADATRAPSWIPVVLAIVVAIFSAWPLYNPVLPLPLAWAIWNMGPPYENYPWRYYAAMSLLLASCVVSCVLIALEAENL